MQYACTCNKHGNVARCCLTVFQILNSVTLQPANINNLSIRMCLHIALIYRLSRYSALYLTRLTHMWWRVNIGPTWHINDLPITHTPVTLSRPKLVVCHILSVCHTMATIWDWFENLLRPFVWSTTVIASEWYLKGTNWNTPATSKQTISWTEMANRNPLWLIGSRYPVCCRVTKGVAPHIICWFVHGN